MSTVSEPLPLYLFFSGKSVHSTVLTGETCNDLSVIYIPNDFSAPDIDYCQ